jgi:hypothetical protein
VSVAALSDDALRGKTDEFRQRIANGESLDDLLVESFAVMREAGKRDGQLLRTFLTANASQMPRTMLRYSIEKFSESERRKWLTR